MTLDTVIMLAGAAIALLPFLGFPPSWDTYIFAALGVLVFALGVIVRRRNAKSSSNPHIPPKQPPQMPLDDGEVA